MKRALMVSIFILSAHLGFAQTPELPKKNVAEVNQVQGVFLFKMSKPLHEYDYLGSTKIKVVWTGQPEEMINITLKKLKKDYPTADRLIFTTMNMDQADVVKFK